MALKVISISFLRPSSIHTVFFEIPHRPNCEDVKSGDRGEYSTLTLSPIHLPGKRALRKFVTSVILCWNMRLAVRVFITRQNVEVRHYEKTRWLESASELYRLSNPGLSKLVPTFAEREVSCSQSEGSLRPYSRISRPGPLLFFQVAPQLYSRGWADLVPDPLLLRKYGSSGNRTRAYGSVTMISNNVLGSRARTGVGLTTLTSSVSRLSR
jgi:hypothetical protein